VVAVADEGVRAVPLVHTEVGVESVGHGVPGHRPAHTLLHPRDVQLRCARGEHERGVARVQVRDVRDLVGDERAAGARVVGPAVDAGSKKAR